MITKKKIIRIRRNPRDLKTNDVASVTLWPISYKFLGEGGYADVYKFSLKSTRILYPLKYFNHSSKVKIKLPPGEYVLKIEKFRKYHPLEIKYFEELSELELIPKIYYIDNTITIMDYAGKPYSKMKYKLSKSDIKLIKTNLENLLKKWHNLGYSHGDLNVDNIVIDDKNIPSLIDPSDPFSKDKKADLYGLKLIFL